VVGHDNTQSARVDHLQIDSFSDKESLTLQISISENSQGGPNPAYTDHRVEVTNPAPLLKAKSGVVDKSTKKVFWKDVGRDILSWVTWIVSIGGIIFLIGLGLHTLLPGLSLLIAVLIGIPIFFLLILGLMLIIGGVH
jgi:hypothetical protein